MSIGLSSGHKCIKIISERSDFIVDQCAGEAFGIARAFICIFSGLDNHVVKRCKRPLLKKVA